MATQHETRFTAARLWAAAVSEHSSTWCETDQKFHKELKCDTGLSSEVISGFLTHYEVARTIPQKRVCQFFAEVKKKSSEVKSSDSFARRAKRLEEAVGDGDKWAFMDKNDCTKISKKSRPFSAASKISWFLNPTNWTLFDSYALLALERKESEKRIERLNFQTFYERLDELKVKDVIKGIDALLEDDKNARSLGLKGSRVFDKMLWIMGSHDYYRRVAGENFEEYLYIGHSIVDIVRDHGLHEHLTNRWGVPKK